MRLFLSNSKLGKGGSMKPEWVFITDLRAARQARRRLFQLTEEQPEAVMRYLDGLPDGVESGDEILTALRRRAQRALRARDAS
jgi:hypothetical protein